MRVPVYINNGVKIEFDDYLELSLNCSICRRVHRTVQLHCDGRPGVCTPTFHKFPCKVVLKINAQRIENGKEIIEGFYRIEYENEPFFDPKYRLTSYIPMSWGRVYFSAICPNCGSISKESSQQNAVKPFKIHCSCGYVLYTEIKDTPIVEVVDE